MSEKTVVIKPHILSFLVQAYCTKKRPNDFMRLVNWATKNEDKMAELMARYAELTRQEQRSFVNLCIKKAPDEAMRTVENLGLLARTVVEKKVTLKTRNGAACRVARVSEVKTMRGYTRWMHGQYPKADDDFMRTYAAESYVFIFKNRTNHFGLIYHIDNTFRKPQEALFGYFLSMWKNVPPIPYTNPAAFYNDEYYDAKSKKTLLIIKAIKRRLSPEILALLGPPNRQSTA
jgi:hypothetical protein